MTGLSFLIAATFAVLVTGGAIHENKKSLWTRIVGGEDTTITEYPWQVSLQVSFSGSSWSHSCGGSIIAPKWVITAGHCVDGTPVNQLRIVAGTTKLSEETSGTIKKLSKITVHPDYNGGGNGFPNDIAILELESPLEFSNKIDKVEMADADTGDFAGDVCDLSGWGRIVGGGSLPDILQTVKMTVLSNTECETEWAGDINDGHICIGNDKDITDKKSACHGDSGGPMTCYSGSTSYLAGATSWGSPTCSGKPNVYSRISHFRDWIKTISGV